MKVLLVGDIVGRYGRNILYSFLNKFKNNYDFIIVNGENAASGFGITEKIAKEFFESGVDVITSGNHIWDKKEIYEYIEKEKRLLRPYNYPKGVPGNGFYIIEKNGLKLAVVNMQGRVFMPASVDCPFTLSKNLIENLNKITNNIIIDFHAETTSEKITLARYLDGKISLLVGTHTHVQTADETILENGTGYISDLGMTGSHNGTIGTDFNIILQKFLTSLPQKFDLAKGNEKLNGIEAEIVDGKCISIKRINWSEDESIRS